MADEKNDNKIVDNIIVDNTSLLTNLNNSMATSGDAILFSALPADAKPIVPYKLTVEQLDYPVFFISKCAICSSPHRSLLEHVYIDRGRNINAVIKFFLEHFNARLNWPQIDAHIKRHCDMSKVRNSGLANYEHREREVERWKYRELDLALTAVLVEIDEISSIVPRTPDESFKKTTVMEKLIKQLMSVKQLRDDASLGLPNVFAVLYDLHDLMESEEDKRIIREKAKALKDSI